MNKREVIEKISQISGVPKTAASDVLNAFLETITEALKSGDQVVLPGFGSFSTGNRAARTARNPQTGQSIQIKATRVAKFRVGKGLKEAVQK